jgi:hypothetical protein
MRTARTRTPQRLSPRRGTRSALAHVVGRQDLVFIVVVRILVLFQTPLSRIRRGFRGLG